MFPDGWPKTSSSGRKGHFFDRRGRQGPREAPACFSDRRPATHAGAKDVQQTVSSTRAGPPEAYRS